MILNILWIRNKQYNFTVYMILLLTSKDKSATAGLSFFQYLIQFVEYTTKYYEICICSCIEHWILLINDCLHICISEI